MTDFLTCVSMYEICHILFNGLKISSFTAVNIMTDNTFVLNLLLDVVEKCLKYADNIYNMI